MKNNTLKYFYEIMKVPRNSGKEQKIVNYLKNYAINNNLSFYCDNFNNIIIYKNKHLKNKIILQSHIDMVCESNCNFDFDNITLTKVINGDFLSAKGTTHGADICIWCWLGFLY